MPPSGTIPTSFVPKQPVQTSTTPRYKSGGSNIFLAIAWIILVISLLGSAGVFGYERYLEGVRVKKAAEVQQVQESVNAGVIEDFIRTRDRFEASQTLLDSHIAVSQFFDLLEAVTLESVRFDSLSFTFEEDGTARIQMSGIARTFNALAAESSAFASEKRIKRAIFSDITVGQDRTVSFSLEAELAPSLLVIAPESAPQVVVPVTPGTPATSTPQAEQKPTGTSTPPKATSSPFTL